MKFLRTTLIIGIVLSLCLAAGLSAQQMTKEKEDNTWHKARKGSSADMRMKAFKKHKALKESSIFKNLKFTNVGPYNIGGRIVDVEACSEKPYTLFAAYASGGLWKTTNGGTTWKSLFDEEASIIMGDIAVHWPHAQTIWVGTGENNSSRSSYSGTGVYKSTDGGETWQHMGLAGTHRTGRIIIDPKNPKHVYVAAMGALYSNNENRGVYETQDGGKTWKKILYVNDRTGAIDLVMNPKDNKILYAAMWERDRRAWNFLESGKGSGIYKTTDGGKNWTRLEKGLPEGYANGRIALDIARSNPDVLYAFIDNQSLRPKGEKDPWADENVKLLKQLPKMSRKEFLALDDERIDKFLNNYGFDEMYTAKNIKAKIKSGSIKISDLVAYIGDANSNLFQTQIKGAELYRTDDGGKSWKKTHDYRLEQVYFTYGYYFGEVRVNPADENELYLLGVPLVKSTDGGKTFTTCLKSNVHVDIHAMWIDPKYPQRIVLGNDGGLNLSYDSGKSWHLINKTPVTQFYTVEVDMKRPYNIYGGTQDNGTVMGTSTYNEEYKQDWEGIYGGDGGYIQVNPKDNRTAILEFQFGNVFRKDLVTGATVPVKPNHKLKEDPLRFNWQSPILMSEHSPEVIYFGASRLFRSLDTAKTWTAISPDLTRSIKPQGDVPYGTITTIAESPLKFGLLYVGADDGRVWVSKGGGADWTEITKGLPSKKWITRVIASKWDESTAYVTLNGYRDDEWNAWVYKTTDYGKTWKSIKANLPDSPVNVIKEDTENKNILYVGTDMGCYISLDGGAKWQALMGAMPNVPVHDMVIHPRDKDLVVGTHGRSIFVLDVANIQKLNKKLMDKPIHIFEFGPLTYSGRWAYKSLWYPYPRATMDIQYYLKKSGDVKITIRDEKGNILRVLEGTSDAGMNVVTWDYELDRKLVEKAQSRIEKDKRKYSKDELANSYKYLAAKAGKYILEIKQGGRKATYNLEIKPGRKVVRSGNGRRPKGP